MRAPRCLAFLSCLAAHVAAQQSLLTVYGPQVGGYTGARVEPAGDMDGDQVPDFLVTSPNIGTGLVQVVSGATFVARNLANAQASSFANAVLVGTQDMNLDGVRDLVVNRGQNLVAYSGASLTMLWQTAGLTFTAATPIGDIDNDGRCDLAAIVYVSGWEYLWTLRGSNGSQIQVSNAMNGFTSSLVSLGDVNGDGKPEVARGVGNTVDVLQTSPVANLFSAQIGGFASAVLAAANLHGDARNEILAANGAEVRVLSSTNGALLRTFVGAANSEFAVVGDLNADGVPDLALRANPGTIGDAVEFVSGANGAVLSRWLGTSRFRCQEVAGVGDLNGDGYGDVVLGDYDASALPSSSTMTGAWQAVSGKVLATMQSQPTACAQGPFFPQLGITRPRIGQTATIEGRDAPAGTVGFLAFSPQPTLPTNLGVVGCDAWFDVTNGSLLHQPSGVNWTFTFAVPPAPQLVGYAFALQAFYAPTFSPIGIDVTNGIWARFGF